MFGTGHGKGLKALTILRGTCNSCTLMAFSEALDKLKPGT